MMMKAILGSALGGLAAGTLALVASAAGRTTAPADPWAMQAANAPHALTVAETRTGSTATTNAPTMVQCEPQQEAMLRRSIVAGREVAEVTCVSRTPMVPVGPEAAYFDSRPAYSQSDIVTRPVVRTQTARPQAARQVVYRDRPVAASRQVDTKKRSWKTTAAVIGGSTAAGAGVGAIAGGKKGALIGAAVGGGAGTVYEVIKRK
jgi:hypothetical protein